jgi:hypothetical protein
MPTAAELADRYAQALLAREAGESDEINHTIQVTQDALAAAVASGTPQFKNDLVRELAKYLTANCPIRAFSIIANTAGMVVELGADEGIALPAILDRLPAMFARVPPMVEQLEKHFGTYNLDPVPPEKWRPVTEKSDEARLAAREFFSLRFAGCAAMTMLSRSPELRIEARQRTELVESANAARDDNPYAYYISEVLGMTDGEELLVIDVPRKLGFRVRLTGVRNNFHLFTLLQGELLNHPTAANWTGPKPHPVAVDVARSARMIEDIPPAEWKAFAGPGGHAYDAAVWTYYEWPAVQPDGALQLQTQVPKGQLPWWVWGEMKPTDIAAFDGQRVVLLGSLEVTRSWGVSFFSPVHPALRSSATVTAVLGTDEVAQWLDRFRTAKR